MEVNPVAMETNATNQQGYNTVWKSTYNKNTILEIKLNPTTTKVSCMKVKKQSSAVLTTYLQQNKKRNCNVYTQEKETQENDSGTVEGKTQCKSHEQKNVRKNNGWAEWDGKT